MAGDGLAYDVLQASLARQRALVYDLYGMFGVSPNASEATVREAYKTIAKRLEPEFPSSEMDIAYNILINPHKRAQYDRDRLEYLYNHFASHENFSASSNPSTRAEQIKVYATALATRVRDPLEDKKAAILARITRTRTDLDEFNEKSLRHRQDWATSTNQILRMAGNALREIVVCAEEDLCMLEDELGRLEGILDPKDQDGPAGRVTSGQFGSQSEAQSGATTQGKQALVNSRLPSLPRSPTQPLQPQSFSKLGIQGEDSSGRGDSSSEGVSEGITELMEETRINNFLADPMANVHVHDFVPSQPLLSNKKHVTASSLYKKVHTRTPRDYSSLPTLATGVSTAADVKLPTPSEESPSPSAILLDAMLPPPQTNLGMGLVDYQAKYGLYNPSSNDDNHADDVELSMNDAFWAALNFHPVRSEQASDYNPLIDSAPPSTISKSADTNDNNGKPDTDPRGLDEIISPEFRKPNRPWRTSTPPGAFNPSARPYTTRMAAMPTLYAEDGVAPGAGGSSSSSFGFHIAQPAERGAGGTAMNLAPGGGGGLPSMARSAGIKDFQVRVWTAANAARAASGAHGTEGGGKDRGEAGGQALREQGQQQKQMQGLSASIHADGSDASTSTLRAGGDDDNTQDVFRRSKGGVGGGRPAAFEMDDPFT